MTETARRKAGRPPLPPRLKRKDRSVWLSDEDVEYIRALTGQRNLTKAVEMLAEGFEGKDTNHE